MKPAVSVVIPLYNKAAYVRRALLSVVNQTFSSLEVLVVDDGSQDNGPDVVAALQDPRIRLIRQQNAGPGAARNKGLCEAKGDVVAFLDADDEWELTFLEEAVKLLESHPHAATVTFGYVEHPGGASQEGYWRRRGLVDGAYRLSKSISVSAVIAMTAYMSPCTTVCRADVIRRWGGFYAERHCRYGEDAFLWLKVLFNEEVVFQLRPLAQIHFEASSLSKNLNAARPVEPFLLDSSELFSACPVELHPLLRQVIAARALKTACVLGYWGQWRDARDLIRRYSTLHDWKLPYYVAAQFCSTPVGAMVGNIARKLLRA